ncbi:hypothetical protein D621_20915 [beta proteobacterium AAP51]|nr:hypothetical protein D621_20915 [beta proteobacterium AAP51]
MHRSCPPAPRPGWAFAPGSLPGLPRLLLGAVLAASASAALAGRPLQTEDAGVLARGDCELEAVLEQAGAGAARVRGRGLGVGCGLWPGLQAGLALATAEAEGQRSRALGLGGKWRLAGAEDGGPQFALTAGLDWQREPGAGWRRAGLGLGVVASLPAGPGTVHLALDHGRDRLAALTTTSWGLAYEAEEQALAGLAWAPMAELVGDDRGGAAFNLGLRLAAVPERLWLDASWGRQLKGERERVMTLGLKWAF